MTTRPFPGAPPAEPPALRLVQMAWLAAAVFVVSVGYGAFMPMLPGWLALSVPGMSAIDIARHVGFLSAAYAAGVLIGAPLWGVVSDHSGRGRILMIGLIGYVTSLLLLLVPGLTGLWSLYALRGATGFFVAAVAPVVAALVAEHTPKKQRARRFAWLGAVSLLGFLVGPGLNAVADWVGSWAGARTDSPMLAAQIVIALSALLGAVMMLGVAVTLPTARAADAADRENPPAAIEDRVIALWWLSGTVTFVLAGFELGIVLQGQLHTGLSSRQVAMMFAECSLVMLGVNALLFLTGWLEKLPARVLMGAGLIVAMAGLAVLAGHRTEAWMYLGVSLASGGTGLMLPVIAYLAAGASPQSLGATMGGLAAAAGFGQTLGSSVGGWLFGMVAQGSFGWLIVPLAVLLVLLLVRPDWCLAVPAEPAAHEGTSRV